jgi:hypothetical protein
MYFMQLSLNDYDSDSCFGAGRVGDGGGGGGGAPGFFYPDFLKKNLEKHQILVPKIKMFLS